MIDQMHTGFGMVKEKLDKAEKDNFLTKNELMTEIDSVMKHLDL